MLAGLCCSVINLQALLLLHEYYQDDFPFVSCISVLGVPVGAAILPPITEKFLEYYGLSGALLILGALVLNMLPIGLVLKVPKTKRSASDDEIRQNQKELKPLMATPSGASGENSRKYVKLSVQDVRSQVDPELDSQSLEYSTKINIDRQSQLDNFGPELSSQECTASNYAKVEQYPQGDKDTLANSPTKDTPEPLLQHSSNCTVVIRPTSGKNGSTCLTFFYLDVLIKEPLFAIFYLPSVLLLFLVTGGWALFVVVYALDHGIDIARGTYLATSGAVGGLVSSFLMSVGLRYRPQWSPYYWMANQALFAVMFFLQVLHSSYIYLLVTSFFIGFGLFGVNVLLEAVLAEVIEKENFPDAGNLFFFAVGIGYLTAGYVSGMSPLCFV